MGLLVREHIINKSATETRPILAKKFEVDKKLIAELSLKPRAIKLVKRKLSGKKRRVLSEMKMVIGYVGEGRKSKNKMSLISRSATRSKLMPPSKAKKQLPIEVRSYHLLGTGYSYLKAEALGYEKAIDWENRLALVGLRKILPNSRFFLPIDKFLKKYEPNLLFKKKETSAKKKDCKC